MFYSLLLLCVAVCNSDLLSTCEQTIIIINILLYKVTYYFLIIEEK